VTVDCQILRILDGVEFSISLSNTAFRPNALWKYNGTQCKRRSHDRQVHPEPRPGSNYRTLFLKGRRIRAAVVYEAIHGPEPRSPEEFAEDYQVPLPAVLEALDYVAQNLPLIEQERDREAARLRARGLIGPAHE
jgi:uncharacterized protein (DUF433 family)